MYDLTYASSMFGWKILLRNPERFIEKELLYRHSQNWAKYCQNGQFKSQFRNQNWV